MTFKTRDKPTIMVRSLINNCRMKTSLSLIGLALLLAGSSLAAILKNTRFTASAPTERELTTKMTSAKATANRKLGLEEDLQREHEDEQNVNNMKLMIVNMKKEGELRTLESVISEIGDRVEEINDTIRSKTNEFIDKVDSVRKSRNKVTSAIKVQKSN